MSLVRLLAALLMLTLPACDEALDGDPSPPPRDPPNASPGHGWAAAATGEGGALLAWVDAEGCVWSLRLDAEGAEAGEPRRLLCGADLPVLDSAVSDSARRQTLLLGRRGSRAVVYALADDARTPPRPLSLPVESAAPLRGVVRGDALYLATLSASRGVLAGTAPRAEVVSVDLPPRARAQVEDAWPEPTPAFHAEVEAPGATEVDLAHDGESVALLLWSVERAWAWRWAPWAAEAGLPVALTGHALSARVTADADGLVWALARGPKAEPTRWPVDVRRVEVSGSTVEVTPRSGGGVWAAWRDEAGDVFARSFASEGLAPDAPPCLAEGLNALNDTRGRLGVVALRDAALVCGRAGDAPPQCARVASRCAD